MLMLARTLLMTRAAVVSVFGLNSPPAVSVMLSSVMFAVAVVPMRERNSERRSYGFILPTTNGCVTWIRPAESVADVARIPISVRVPSAITMRLAKWSDARSDVLVRRPLRLPRYVFAPGPPPAPRNSMPLLRLMSPEKLTFPPSKSRPDASTLPALSFTFGLLLIRLMFSVVPVTVWAVL